MQKKLGPEANKVLITLLMETWKTEAVTAWMRPILIISLIQQTGLRANQAVVLVSDKSLAYPDAFTRR